MFNKSEKKAPYRSAKPLHDVPNMEDIEDGVTYAFTLNPKKIPYKKDSSKYYASIQMWMAEVQETLNKEKNLGYKLYLEFSKVGRPHFHGYITIKDAFIFTVFNVENLMPIGAMCIKKIDTADDWLKYCTKQTKRVEKWCKKFEIPYPVTNESPMAHVLKTTKVSYEFVETYDDSDSDLCDENVA